MKLTERYREQANWARSQAEKAETPELQDQWLSLGREYDRLAVESRENTENQ
jgi:hypothetical protein